VRGEYPSSDVDSFAKVIAALRDLKGDGLVSDYALGGAMAMTFWSEPTPTFDVDVFVLLDQSSLLVSLEPLYSWARARGYGEKGEHIMIATVPVQLIPAHNALTVEAVSTAANLSYSGEPVRVIRPEYLIAMALDGSARTQKRLTRVALLLEQANVDRGLLDRLVQRYKLRLPAT
jgi:hypothetical protein